VTALPPIAAERPAVLLVDDDPAVANALQFSLDLEGFDVRTFRDGESLLASQPLPLNGCLVLDYNLPGMDGLSLLETLRLADVRLPAILITTNPKAILRGRAAAAGAPIVEKPLLTDSLVTSVRDALAAQKRRQAESPVVPPAVI
jgi:FixJ family two-component response regulator